jgi:MoxR-like ATPase
MSNVKKSPKLRPGKPEPAFPVQADGGKLQAKFAMARKAFRDSLIARERQVDILLTALLCKQNALLVGLPGTAKSHMTRSLADLLGIGRPDYFEYLLTKFTDPGELFGPVDITALKQGRTERAYHGFLPTAVVAFIDECFKGSSAILNTLLNIINEKQFIFGQQLVQCPLWTVVGAANEFPDGEELGALFDRFLIRDKVSYMQADTDRKEFYRRILAGDDFRPNFTSTITLNELQSAHDDAMNLPYSNDAKTALWDIMTSFDKRGDSSL